MISIQVRLPHNDRVEALSGRVLADIRKGAANNILRLLKTNFAAYGTSKYWQEAADSTKVETGGPTARVMVTQTGVRLHWLGGTVKPGKGTSSKTGLPTKLLAIPTAPGNHDAPGFGAYVWRPWSKGKVRGLLYPATETIAKRKYKDRPAGRTIMRANAQATPAYLLVTETVHPRNPNVIPANREIKDAAREAARSRLYILTKYHR